MLSETSKKLGAEDLARQVEEVLEKKVRPILLRDGGNVAFGGIGENGTLILVYTGRCSGCPAIEWTHERITVPAISQTVPNIRKIEWRFEI